MVPNGVLEHTISLPLCTNWLSWYESTLFFRFISNKCILLYVDTMFPLLLYKIAWLKNLLLLLKIGIPPACIHTFKYLDKRPLDVSMNTKKIQKRLNFRMSKFSVIAKKIIKNLKINEKILKKRYQS